MSNRYGGFRTRKLFSVWDDRKSPSATNTQVPESIQQFEYSNAKGIWNLRSTTQFSKKQYVVDGLSLHLTCFDSASYPGTGNKWYDLSGKGYHGTLLNSPSFSNDAFTLNGTNQGVVLNPNPGTSFVNSFTWEFLCKPTTTHGIDSQSTSGTGGTSGQRYIVGTTNSGNNGGAGVSMGTNGVSVYEHGSAYMPSLLVSSQAITASAFSHIVITYTNKQPRFYLNGNLIATGLTSPRPSVFGHTATIGYDPQYGYFPGSISMFRAYSRALSLEEIQKNYNYRR